MPKCKDIRGFHSEDQGKTLITRSIKHLGKIWPNCWTQEVLLPKCVCDLCGMKNCTSLKDAFKTFHFFLIRKSSSGFSGIYMKIVASCQIRLKKKYNVKSTVAAFRMALLLRTGCKAT